MKKMGKILVGVLVLAAFAGAYFAAVAMSVSKADEKASSKAAELVIDYAKRDVDLTIDYRKGDAELAKQLKGVADTNAKLAKQMSEGLLSLKSTEANANSALEVVAETKKDVESMKVRLDAVEDKLSKPTVVVKPEPINKPAVVAKPELINKPAVVAKPAVKKPAVAKKPVKKAVVKKTIAKKSAKVVKAKSVKLDAGVKTVITVGPNKGGQMEVTLDIFK